MRPCPTLILLSLAGSLAGTAQAASQVVPTAEPARVFAGVRALDVRWQNTGDTDVGADMSRRLTQATSGTAFTLGERPWKRLHIPRRQTVLEHAALDFPEVATETRFLIQRIEGTNRSFGITKVFGVSDKSAGGIEDAGG